MSQSSILQTMLLGNSVSFEINIVLEWTAVCWSATGKFVLAGCLNTKQSQIVPNFVILKAPEKVNEADLGANTEPKIGRLEAVSVTQIPWPRFHQISLIKQIRSRSLFVVGGLGSFYIMNFNEDSGQPLQTFLVKGVHKGLIYDALASRDSIWTVSKTDAYVAQITFCSD